jgi:Ca2+-binding RTX toxin-like protein
VIFAFAAAGVLIAPAASDAATLVGTAPGPAGKLTYTALPAEQNNLTVAFTPGSPGTYTFTDTAPITPSGTCTSNGAMSATCPDPQAATGDVCQPKPLDGVCPADFEIDINLGALDDRATATGRDSTTDIRINGGPGTDSMTGLGTGGRDTFFGGAGNDLLVGGPNDDRLFGVTETEQANGTTSGGDTIRPGFGADTMAGGSGDDRFEMGPVPQPGVANDQISVGGAGEDTLSYAERSDPVIVNWDVDLLRGAFAGDAHSLSKTIPEDLVGLPAAGDVEDIEGGKASDLLIGSDIGNVIKGGSGADTICGGQGAPDTVDYSDVPATERVKVTLGAPNKLPDGSVFPIDSRIASTGITDAGAPDHRIKVRTTTAHGLQTGDQVIIKWSNEAVNNGGLNPTATDPAHRNPATWTVTVLDEKNFVLNDSTFKPQQFGGNVMPGNVTPVKHVDGTSYPQTRSSACMVGDDQTGDEGNAQDCLPDDGVGLGAEGDCVADNVENVIGGKGDDVLIGSDPLLQRAKDNNGQFNDSTLNRKSQVAGQNVLSGCDGNDLLVGGKGADVFEGDNPGFFVGRGDTTTCGNPGSDDIVTYQDAGFNKDEPRGSSVQASINGVKDDGNPSDDTELLFEGFGDGSPLRPSFDAIGTGIDHVIGGNGSDHLTSESPATLEGGGGNDLIDGSNGNDTLSGAGGDDTINGNGGDDGISGGDGNDSMTGGTGADTMSGGDGTDLVDYSVSLTPVSVTADGAPGDGPLNEGDNVLPDVESLTGGADNDNLVAGPGDGVVSGGGGNDSLDGGGGADTLIGGEGIDGANYSGRGGPVTVTLNVPGGDGEPGENDNVANDVENAAGGSGNDTLIGDGGSNQLDGGGGGDNISGGGGFDNLNGGSGNDVLSGGDATDLINGGDGNDTLNGDGGDDTMNGGLGDDTLDGGPGADQMGAGGGNDTVTYANRSADIEVTLDGNANDGAAGEKDFIRTDVASVTTGSGDDLINSRDGLSGNISCGAGNDTVAADIDDDVAGNCENIEVSALTATRCRISRSVTSTASSVTIRLTCPVAAAGTVTLQTARKVRVSQRASVLRIGKKRFTVKRAGQSKRITMKLSKKAKKLLRRHKTLRVRAVVKARPRGVRGSSVKRLRGSRTLMVRRK